MSGDASGRETNILSLLEHSIGYNILGPDMLAAPMQSFRGNQEVVLYLQFITESATIKPHKKIRVIRHVYTSCPPTVSWTSRRPWYPDVHDIHGIQASMAVSLSNT